MTNEDVLNKYLEYLRQEYQKKTTVMTYSEGVKQYLNYIDKPLQKTTQETVSKWKEYINQIHKQNTVKIWCFSINKFYKWLGLPEIKVSVPRQLRTPRKVFSKSEKEQFLNSAKQNPLHNLVALALYDSLLRPSEIINIKISNIDSQNHCIYLDYETKANPDISALMSPRFERAIADYLKVRPVAKPEFDDYLIIIKKGIYKGRRYLRIQVIRDITRKIALQAGITKRVTPYKTVKPSGITLRLNDMINPRTIQRLARHKDIKTTLGYDHTTDKDVLNYLENQDQQVTDYSKLSPKSKAQVLIDKLFNGEINNATFNAGIELLQHNEKKEEKGDPAYV